MQREGTIIARRPLIACKNTAFCASLYRKSLSRGFIPGEELLPLGQQRRGAAHHDDAGSWSACAEGAGPGRSPSKAVWRGSG